MYMLRKGLIALLIFFAGCSARNPSERVTITYQTIETLPAQRMALNQLAEEFHRLHPDIQVKIQISPSGFQKLQAQLASGTAPDVFYYVSDRLPSLMHRNAVLNLTPFLQQDPQVDLGAYFSKILESCQSDGGLYCFPFHFSTDVLFYNKDLFDRAGLPYPGEDWTWDDFARTAKSLTQKQDGEVLQYGTLQPRPMLLVKAFGGECFAANQCVIDAAPAVKAMEYLKDLTDSGAAPQTAALRDIEMMDGVTLFSTGRIGMLLGRTYMLVEFSKLKEFDWDVALVPKGDIRYNRLAVGGNCIWSGTKHPQEAWAFVKFFSGPEGSRFLGSVRNCVPALRLAAESEIFLRAPPRHVEVFVQSLESAQIENPGMVLWQEYLDKVITPGVESFLFGKISAPEALRQMQYEGEEYLKEEAKIRTR